MSNDVRPAAAQVGTSEHRVETLPARLQKLAPLFLTGLSQKQMAQQTGLSYHTVRSYAKELYARLGVGSREQLIAKLRSASETRT